MIIDWHTHVYPPEYANSPRWEGRCPMVLENVLEVHERAGVDLAVISNTAHYVGGRPDDEAFKGLQRWDEYSAEIAQKYPTKTICFATTVPGGGDRYLKELERAGIIGARREARSIVYAANYSALSGLLQFLMQDCCAGRPEICLPALALPCCTPQAKEAGHG